MGAGSPRWGKSSDPDAAGLNISVIIVVAKEAAVGPKILLLFLGGKRV